jgi:hypothetical protein
MTKLLIVDSTISKLNQQSSNSISNQQSAIKNQQSHRLA